MKTIASLEPAEAQEIVERLRSHSIRVEFRIVPQESGLEQGEVLVHDDDYDRACALAEAWEAERQDEAEKRRGVICPKCGSYHVRVTPHPVLGYIRKCKDCGHEFPMR